MRPIFIVALLLLAACAGPIETRIDSRGVTAARPESFAIDPASAGVVSEAQKMVVQALLAKGYRAAEIADVSLQVTLSDRPANVAVLTDAKVMAPAAGKKRCAKREYRLGVIMTTIADGSLYYQSQVAEFHCKMTFSEVLPSLVDAALADVGAPRSSYTVKRRR